MAPGKARGRKKAVSVGRAGSPGRPGCEGRATPFPVSAGRTGADPRLSLQVKSSLQLLPDHLPLLKLCPPGPEEGEEGPGGWWWGERSRPSQAASCCLRLRDGVGEMAPASRLRRQGADLLIRRHRKCCQTTLFQPQQGQERAGCRFPGAIPGGSVRSLGDKGRGGVENL